MELEKVIPRGKPLRLVASFIIIVLMFFGLFWGLSRLSIFLNPKSKVVSEITIRALEEDKLGLDPETAFLLTSRQALDEKTIRDSLKITPSVSYKLEKGSGGREYKIIPQESLAANTVYAMSFDATGQGRENNSWAFQTKSKFRVISTLPANTTTHVPVNTGIEMTFSHENYDTGKIKDYISITPQVEGRFEQHKKTLVFVPQELLAGTVYTVTIKKGLPLSGSSEVLADDYSFSFETAPLEKIIKESGFDLEEWGLTEFAVGEAPVFTAYYYSQNTLPSLTITTYQYPDAKAFVKALAQQDKIPRWCYWTRNSYQEDFSALTKVGEYKTEFLTVDSYNHYVVFPEALPAGYYAAEIKAGNAVRQVRFEVTNLASYLVRGEEKSVLWVNNLETKAPVAEAHVRIEGKGLDLKGDSSGVIAINGSLGLGTEEGKTDYALVEGEGQQAVVPLEPRLPYYDNDWLKGRDYWKHLYLDRELYLPGDEVHFWGVLSPRSKEVKETKKLRIELIGSYGPLYEGAEDTPLLSQDVQVSNNIYTGNLRLPVLAPGYYYLRVRVGDTIMLTHGFSVETYQKPSYRLIVTPEKRAIFAGEGINFQTNATFFEGTPVPGLSLNYNINGKNGTVFTDEKGIARIPYIGRMGDTYNVYNYQYLGVSTTLPEAGEITGFSWIYVFKSKYYLTGEASCQEEGDGFTVQARLSRVNLSKINAGEYPIEENFSAGPQGNTLVKGSIYQDIWEKKEIGERYDFINKRVEKVYSYRHSTSHISDFSMITDESGKSTYSGRLNPDNSYYLELTAEDNEGREIKRKIPIRGSGQGNPYNYQYYYLQASKQEKGYQAGEEVNLSFMNNEQELKAREKGFLYFLAQKQIQSVEVTSQPRYNFTFEESFIPNVYAYGVYFDGHSYQETESCLVLFDKDEKALEVKIETDKAEYRPGDTVRLNVQVSGRDNKGVQSRVNLNLVDEALYSLRDQQVDLLGSLYGDYICPLLQTRKSHYHPERMVGAEKGGEGDSERKDFRDTVLFTTLETGRDGKAQTEFKLPDNLTSWRVTYQALAPGLFAGSGTAQIPVKLPFFVEMMANDQYMEGDSPVIVLRSYGEKLVPQKPVSYNMKLVTPGGEEIKTSGESVSFAAYDWKLPSLQTGKYTLTVEGKNGDYQDKLTKEFTVVRTFLERTVSHFELLQDGLKLEEFMGKEEPTALIFSDYEKGQYLQGLFQLSWQNGSRFEQKLAVREVRKLLGQYFPEEGMYSAENEEESFLSYQQPDGGIAILPYAESELALTALAASCCSEDFDRQAMAGYFYRVLNNESEEDDISLALWGLAALNEPVLIQVNNFLEEKDITPSEKINLALASLDIGNGAIAQEVFRELLTEYGEDQGTTMRIKTGRDQDEIIQATTQIALLAARLDDPLKNKLYQYLLENRGKDILNLVEQVMILKYDLQYMNTNPVSFSYELQGQKVDKTLKGRETHSLILLPGEAANLKFSNVQGKVGVLSVYTAPYSAQELTSQEGLTVTRSYLVNNKKVDTFSRTDLVEITITFDIGEKTPAGSYEIVDVLPAGLRYVSRPYIRNQQKSWYLSYPSEVKGQKLTFTAWNGNKKITYYARVISPGEFTAEPPLLNNINSSKICVLGNKNRIVIK